MWKQMLVQFNYQMWLWKHKCTSAIQTDSLKDIYVKLNSIHPNINDQCESTDWTEVKESACQWSAHS